jgi:hypothetical protein
MAIMETDMPTTTDHISMTSLMMIHGIGTLTNQKIDMAEHMPRHLLIWLNQMMTSH